MNDHRTLMVIQCYLGFHSKKLCYGYQKHELIRILNKFQRKRSNQPPTPSENTYPTQIVVFPWVPGLSPKLRKLFRNAGYKTVFKSSSNLKSLLTSHNKSKLPPLSQPVVYMTSCWCVKKYVEESCGSFNENHTASKVHYRWKMGHKRRFRRILLDRDETPKNGRGKIWEESTRSIGNSAPTDVAT